MTEIFSLIFHVHKAAALTGQDGPAYAVQVLSIVEKKRKLEQKKCLTHILLYE